MYSVKSKKKIIVVVYLCSMPAIQFHASDCKQNCVESTTVSYLSLKDDEVDIFTIYLNICAYKYN